VYTGNITVHVVSFVSYRKQWDVQ